MAVNYHSKKFCNSGPWTVTNILAYLVAVSVTKKKKFIETDDDVTFEIGSLGFQKMLNLSICLLMHQKKSLK